MKSEKLDYLNYYAIVVCNDVMEIVSSKTKSATIQTRYDGSYVIKATTDDYMRYIAGANLICIEVGQDEYTIL